MGNKLSNDEFLLSFKHCDIIILTETWRSDQFNLPGYDLLTNPSRKHHKKKNGRSSGGLALGFKTALKQGINYISKHENFIWVKLDKDFFNIEQPIFLCAIYIPPQDSPYFNPDIFTDLEKDITKFSTEGLIMLTGDLNARTGCVPDFDDSDFCTHIPGVNLPQQNDIRRRKNYDPQVNDHGKSLIELCKTCELRIVNGRTTGDSFGRITYHSPKGISTVDYFIVSHEMLNLINNFIVKEPTIFSDHSQLICWLNFQPPASPKTDSHSKVKTYNIPKQFIWDQSSAENFRNALKHDDFLLRISAFENTEFTSDHTGIDLATEQFTKIITDTCLRSLKVPCLKKKPKKHKLWFDKDCALLRKNLSTLSNKKHRNPHDTNLRHNYHTSRKAYKKLIKCKKSKHLNSQIEDLVSHKDSHKFWDYLKLLKEGHNTSSNNHDIPADRLYTHFQNLHSSVRPSSLLPSHNTIREKLSSLEDTKTTHNYLDETISLAEIESMTKLLQSKKAPGPDKIRNEMLKAGLQYLKTALCKLFNLILKSGFFPSSWCEGIITPIYKSGNKNDPSNYRGICISSCLGKLFTSVLNARLKNHVLQQKILHHAQIGFLPNHRTSDHIFTLRTLVDKYVNHNAKGKLFTCFIDFKKAFDSVWHDGLFYKLLHYQIGGNFYDLIRNLYSKTKCSIKNADQRTEFFDYQKGVRQGCILSPMLFNLYLNDIPFLLDREDTDPIALPNGSNLNCLLYADDLVLISHSAKGLQKALSILEKYCNDWLLSINPKKTKVVIFQKKCRKSFLDKHLFLINNDKIEIATNYTYLGINFTANGNFSMCKRNLKDKARRSIFATRRYLDFSKLPLDVTNKLFDSLFLPILLYGSEVWGIYDKDDFNNWEKDDVEKTQIYFCKQFLGVNKQCPNVATRNELGRLPLKLAVETSIIKFWMHLNSLPENNIAKQCLQLSKEMVDKTQTGLMHKINQLCKQYNTQSMTLNTNNEKLFASHIKENIRKALIAHQLKLINTNRKLHFYCSFKTDTKKSDFLDAISNPHHRTTVNKFRLGNHQLRIETGRHTVPKTPLNLRICSFCHSGEIENEMHFLFSCKLYDDLRLNFFNKLADKYCIFNELDKNDKSLFLSNNIDPIVCRLTATFVFKAMTLRHDTLFSI